MNKTLSRLASLVLPEEWIRFRGTEELRAHLETLGGIEWKVIGESREGRPIFGYEMGRGKHVVSIIAGSHADEPVGPITAQLLPLVLVQAFPELLLERRFVVVPQMNPDGAKRNSSWFADPPDFKTYVKNAVREAPGDDIEFGFGEGENARPENRAAMGFLKAHAPFAAHFSLHGMGYSEGAWYLICEDWCSHAEGMMDDLAAFTLASGMPLHEIDRQGEKGFRRFRRGFCSTPTHTAMRDFFLKQSDPEMAAKFMPNSMELAASWGGKPLCAVSELPLFQLNRGTSSIGDPVYLRFKRDLEVARAEDTLDKLIELYDVQPLSMALQVRFQLALILLGIEAAS